jgi:linoleoyl-CoA desaturase
MESTARISFDKTQGKAFATELRKAVDAYFADRNLSRKANTAMILKTCILFLVTFGAYGLILSGQFSLWQMWLLCVVMGVGVAGIGFNVAHDAIHGAYSDKPIINRLLGWSMNLIGGASYVWRISHNIVHHTYTNIHEADEDLEVAPILRMSPHAPLWWIHRFQHIYAFVVYSLATFFWVFIKDYKKLSQAAIGIYPTKKHPIKEILFIIFTKLLYYTYMIIIPLWVVPVTIGQFIIGFLTVHLVAGIILGIVFQLAHVVEKTAHVAQPTDGKIENAWILHQLATTSDFARNNAFVTWYCGGLNFQVVHHLFPQVCSIHYPALSRILEKVTKEFGITYHYYETFFEAVYSHYKVLKRFGRPAEALKPVIS